MSQQEPATKRTRKNQTKACVACKAKHIKCVGPPPCAYCSHLKINCEFTLQAKRGPNKFSKPKAHKITPIVDEGSYDYIVEYKQEMIVSGMFYSIYFCFIHSIFLFSVSHAKQAFNSI